MAIYLGDRRVDGDNIPATNISGILPVSNGGTGVATIAGNGTAGKVLASAGSDQAAEPSWRVLATTDLPAAAGVSATERKYLATPASTTAGPPTWQPITITAKAIDNYIATPITNTNFDYYAIPGACGATITTFDQYRHVFYFYGDQLTRMSNPPTSSTSSFVLEVRCVFFSGSFSGAIQKLWVGGLCFRRTNNGGSGSGAWSSWVQVEYDGIPAITITSITGSTTQLTTGVKSVAAAIQTIASNIASLFSSKANIASPTFTGTVTVPTPTVAGAAATKQYVDNAISAIPASDLAVLAVDDATAAADSLNNPNVFYYTVGN